MDQLGQFVGVSRLAIFRMLNMYIASLEMSWLQDKK